MKRLPERIERCGMCPYFTRLRNSDQGECNLMQNGYSPPVYALALPPNCPLEDAIDNPVQIADMCELFEYAHD
ncbi:MAG TPA: hypothetical protein ACFYEK_17945 [Candidatus Wunengus sp. YC60]|uniref:hypothetical protein n=1 Tax=Candidatus Wunengus sp. YC60 TaxID=3367697 RepID=UPI0040285A36